MITALTEERIVFLVVIFSLPALAYAVQKLFGKKILNKRSILIIYVILSWIYFDIVDDYYRKYIQYERVDLSNVESDFGEKSLKKPQDEYASLREQMVREQIIKRGIRDERVLAVMRKVPRHQFVPAVSRHLAYEDYPLPIGYGQTISQPYIVAYMTEQARLKADDRVLEIGTGSGYQAAVLAELAKEVYTIEIVAPLAEKSKKILLQLGYKNVFVKHGDGYQGWEEYAPFDVIIITAAPEEIPMKLTEQLKSGGRMIVPVGRYNQFLYRFEKTLLGLKKQKMLPVRFVPMVHENE